MADPILREVYNVIERQVLHLTGMVDDLLDIYCITHGRMLLRKERVDLARFLRQTVRDLQYILDNAGLTLDLETPGEPLWVLADRRRLQQVVRNLLHNAAKFTDRGGWVRICVTRDRLQPWGVVTVRDTGIGIEPALLPHVFEVFTQAGEETSSHREGLGLGLALVKGLVELQGGKVQADSPGLGKGTRITFSLPLDERPQDGAGPAGGATERKLRILIVEDNRDAARSLQVLLTRYGYDVTAVYDGIAAVQAARREQPDVVLCDLGLPGLNGYGVARALRRDPALCLARLIAVSGYGQEDDRRRSQEAGFDLHMTKPVDPVELQRLLGALPRPGAAPATLPARRNGEERPSPTS
jgi:CheY-like chemotaxis protein/anti-sigma regulatory factor (Ser/Thr protein kinase)